MKLTQAEVAKALNVTPGYISNVENNRTAMSCGSSYTTQNSGHYPGFPCGPHRTGIPEERAGQRTVAADLNMTSKEIRN